MNRKKIRTINDIIPSAPDDVMRRFDVFFGADNRLVIINNKVYLMENT